LAVGILAIGGILAGATRGWGVSGTVWTTLPSMPTARAELGAAAAPCPAGQKGTCVYTVGGLDNNGVGLATTQSYNPADDAWTTLSPMPIARGELAAAAAPCPAGQTGTCVYALGGDSVSGIVATVESYNPATNAWSTDSSMPTAREFLAAAAAPCPAGQTGTCVYAMGGDLGLSGGSPLPTVESYNPATNAWSTDAPMPTARTSLAASPAFCPAGQTGTCVYAVGGSNFQVVGGVATGGDLATNESYNPVTNAWTTLTSMPTARDVLAAATATCPAGETGSCIYAAGGATVASLLGTLEAFDPPLGRHRRAK
jgi:hypothetical protein